jgi:iron(III) transport system substrate-binding protein
MAGKARARLVGLALLTLLPTAPVASQQKLVIYSSNEDTLHNVVFPAFRAETGIAVEPVSAGSGVVIKRIHAEKEQPRGDVVWGISRQLLEVNKALFAPYVPAGAAAIDPKYREPNGLWTGTNLHVLVILQNTQSIPADQGPRNWTDLLDPKWKGKIAFTDPANSGSAFTTLTMLVDLWGGGDAGLAKVRELLANCRVLNRSSLVFQGVGNGEYPLAISLEYAGYVWASHGAPVKAIYPLDGTVVQMEGVAVIKGGPDAAAGKAFAEYVTRKDVRETILKATFRRPTRGDLALSELPGKMPELSALKLLPYDEDGWNAKRAQTLETFKDLIQATR